MLWQAIYYIDLKLMSGQKQLVHLGAKIDLKPLIPDTDAGISPVQSA